VKAANRNVYSPNEGYAYTVKVWDMSIVQGPFSVAPCNVTKFCVYLGPHSSLSLRPFSLLARLASLILTPLSPLLAPGMHASASPFEAMAERANWLGADISKDIYGKTMLAAGLPMSTIVQWTQDPQVPLADGSKGSLFDALEDTNAAACLEKSKAIASRK
jgi:hypothetical protein